MDIGERFATALAAKDADGLRELLQPELDFRAMTPGQFWEADDSATVIDDVLLGQWFEPSDEIKELLSVETASVGQRNRVGDQLRVENLDGEHLVKQQAYYEHDGHRIGWLGSCALATNHSATSSPL